MAIFAFGYSLISGRVEKLPVSAPIVFVIVGLLLGPLGLGWFRGDVSRETFRVLVDITLVLILFIDAASSNTSVLRSAFRIPTRMLLLGLPGSIALGGLVAWLLFDNLSVYECAILGTMLAATDAALGKAVVTNPDVPAHLREGLNSESGLNDGLCVPILLVFIALTQGQSGEGSEIRPLLLVAEEVGKGAVVGMVVVASAVWLLERSVRLGWISSVWNQISVPAVAVSCFAIAQSIHGSGYIAAFIGGMLFGVLAGDKTHKLVMPGEGVAEALAMMTWLIFGIAVIGQIAPSFTWEIVLYSLLSLTVIRMLPVFLSLAGTGESLVNKLFLGWFGPRGLASIVFAIMVFNENIPGSKTISTIVACTVAMSLVLHGISANPLAKRIGSKQADLGDVPTS